MNATGSGRVIADRYELGKAIGRGASSAVYRARDRRLMRDVAVKLIEVDTDEPPTSAGGGDSADASSRVRQRFEREAVAVAKLRHEGIVRVFDTGIDAGTPYLIMEVIEGETLAQAIRAGRPFEHNVRAVAETAEAVAYAHTQGVLHRDLKPANVLIDGKGRAKVVDFGLALDRSRETRITQTGELVGTPAYLAPESARGQMPDERTDVYGLGAMLYEVLTGQPPFTGTAAWQVLRAVLDDDPCPPRQLDASVPWDLEAVTLRALEKHPIHRYPSAESLALDLRRYLNGEPVEARRVGLSGISAHLRAFVRRNRSLMVVLAALALFGLGLLAREPGLEVGRFRRARAEELMLRAANASSPDERIHLLRETLARDGGFHQARLQLGDAYYRLARRHAQVDNAAEATKAFAQALHELEAAGENARRPVAALAWTTCGQAIEAFGWLFDGEAVAGARRAYEQARRQRLETPAALFADGRLAELDGRLDDARGYYDELLRTDAFYTLGFARRAELRVATGDLEGAIADAVRAVELSPAAFEARVARANVRAARGDATGAETDRALAKTLGWRPRAP